MSAMAMNIDMITFKWETYPSLAPYNVVEVMRNYLILIFAEK